MAVNRSKVQQKAEKLVAAGKLEAAVGEYQRLVGDNPRDLGTLNKIGDLYVRMNRKGDAIKTFTRISEIYAEDGFFLKAIAIYKKITKIDPSSIEIMQRLAELYARQGLKTEARAQYQAVAQAYMKSGSPQDAIEAYEALVSLEPESVQHRLALAELKAKCGMHSEAAGTLLALGLELERRGDTKESARIYELAFKTSRGDPEVAERLSSALLSSGQHDRARQIAEKILETHPDSGPMLEVRGRALEAEGRDQEAEMAYKLCLDKNPEQPGALIGLARILASKGAHAEASENLSGGMEVIVEAGRGQEAAEILETILEQKEDFRPALEDLYRLQSMLGDGTATVAAGRRLIDASLESKQYSEAMTLAKRLMELEPGVAEHTDRLRRIQELAEGKEPAGEDVDLGAPPAGGAPVASEEVEAEFDVVEEESGIEIEEEEVPLEEEPGPGEEELAPPAVEPEERTLSSEDEDFIAERMTEADVFVKYGLSDRAIEQLASIAQRFPWHSSTRERLRDLYLEEGNRARAAIEAIELGKIKLQDGDGEGASAALDEARSIDTACPAIAELEALIRGEPVPSPGSLAAQAAMEEELAAAEQEQAAGESTVAAEEEEDSVPMAAAPVDSSQEADDVFDLAAELDASLFGEGDGVAGEGEAVVSELEATPEAETLNDIVNAFKSEVDKQIDKEDFETHYDLGIAYKEMGLLDEAIAEFQFASKSDRLLPSCCSMLGMCFREKGMQSIAVKWYRKGLDALVQGSGGGASEEQLKGLRYDLADILEQMGELQQARDLLAEVYGVDSRYRDVADRVKALQERIGT